MQIGIIKSILIGTILLISGCASTSSYMGGIGAYQNYDGFRDYLNRYSPNGKPQEYYKDNTYSTNGQSQDYKDSIDNQYDQSKQDYKEPQDNLDRDSKVTSYNENLQTTPPPSNIKLGEARDSEAIQRATMKPYQINDKWYYPQKVSIGESYDGIASWYGPDFHSKKTSNGEMYDMNLHTAAHKTLPMNTIVKVVSKDTGKSTIVRINDRGPFIEGRIIDLSNVAAKDIDMIKIGTARVNIEVIGFGGVVSKELANHSTIIKDMVNSSNLKDEFKTGNIEKTFEGGNFAVQIGAFRNKGNAQYFRDTHQYTNYSTQIKEGELNNSAIFRVFVSGFKSENEAKDFIQSNKIDGFVIRD